MALRPIAIGAGIGAAIGAVAVLLWLRHGSDPVAARRPGPGAVAAMPVLKPSLPEPIGLPPEERPRVAATAMSVPPPVARPAAPHVAPAVPPAPTTQLAALPPPAARPPAHPGAPAWRRNAVAVAPARAGVPRIAVVIDDLGPRQQATMAAIALPAPLTLAFLPYAEDLSQLVGRARGAGHEIIVHMPMEPMSGSVDPGPGALRVALPADELRRRIAGSLGRLGGYVGLNNHMGSRFTADRTAMTLLVEEMAARGLLLLDSRTTAGTVAEGLARAHGVPFVARDVFLDNDQHADAVEAKLAETEAVARRKGHAVAIGHPHPATRAALAQWLPQAAARGFQLVPISSLAHVAAEGEARR
ncbi:MAG: divergent polysaccharide deacetylase family protein [Alphaproteobacteria bacterium]|nr:divergent polysaccharide deacetylase family protein [Alphaproteobacteria bacterium]